MSARVLSLAGLILLLAVWPAAAQEQNDEGGSTDWLHIPGFSVEASLGTGVDEAGDLEGEATTFPATVGVVYCRVAMIGANQSQKVTVVWYREDEEVARATLWLTVESPRGEAHLAIPAGRAGTWRIEVIGDGDEVLAVLPFVVGQPSQPEETTPKRREAAPAQVTPQPVAPNPSPAH